MVDDIEKLAAELEKSYPSVEASLVRAILSDYDLSDSKSISDARTQLETINSLAITEEDTEFDPSGTHGHVKSSSPSASRGGSGNSNSENGIKSGAIDSQVTSLPGEPSSVDLNFDPNISKHLRNMALLDDGEESDDNSNIVVLAGMFPSKSKGELCYVLKKCNDDVEQAMETLLNLQFLESGDDTNHPYPVKGVDGFDEAFVIPKKTKRGKSKLKSHNLDVSSDATKMMPEIHAEYVQYRPDDISASESSSATGNTPSHSGSSATLAAARNTAFMKSLEYAKKAKSNHLMYGAASYYAAEARNYQLSKRAAEADEANELVAKQSTSTSVDLHGVAASQAARVSLDYVQNWWDGLGEARAVLGARDGIGDGFKIVVGKGNHSSNGRGVLMAPVKKALLENGWKVEVRTAEILVKGKIRK